MKKDHYNMIKNLVYSSISTLTSLFLFILLIFVGRFLGVEEYGIFTFALAFVTIFEMFTDFGLRDISVRNVSRDRNLTGKYISNLLLWKLLLCLVIYMILVFIVNILQYDSRTKLVVYIMAIASFLKSFKYTYRLFFQVHNRFDLDTLMVLIERVSQLIICLVVLILWKDLIVFVISFAGIRLIDFMVTLGVIHKKVARVKPRLDFHFMRELQIEALPLGLFFIIIVILSYIDSVMLSKMRGYNDVGLYNAAFRLYEGITIIPTIFFVVVLPRLSELFTTNQDSHRQLSVRLIKYMFIIAMPILAYGIFFSDIFIHLFFGDAFADASRTFQILVAGIAFQFPNWMLITTLMSINKQKVILVMGLTGVICNIILNVIFIPIYSYEGAAVATVLAELLMFTVAIFYLAKQYMSLHLFHIAVKPVIALMCIIILLKLLSSLSMIPLIVLSSGIYVAVLFLLRTFDRNEINGFIFSVKSMCSRST